jgi:hypothetical protein
MSPPGLMAKSRTGGSNFAETLELAHGVSQFEPDRLAP